MKIVLLFLYVALWWLCSCSNAPQSAEQSSAPAATSITTSATISRAPATDAPAAGAPAAGPQLCALFCGESIAVHGVAHAGGVERGWLDMQ